MIRPASIVLIRAARRAIAVTSRGPGEALWHAVYRCLARVAAGRAPAGSTVYARGSLASDRVAPGVSDIDLVVVCDAHPPPRPHDGRLIGSVVYSQAELDDALDGPALTYGLDDGRALFHRSPPLDDPLWLRARPGLAGPAADWRRLRGPERRREAAARDDQDLRIAVWLELQWWWRHAVQACARPGAAHHARLAAKLVAEGARAVLLLAADDHRRLLAAPRHEVLRCALRALPEEETAVRRALVDLDRVGPADLGPPVAAFARLSTSAATRLSATVPPGAEIPLIGDPDGPPRPLADWRAVVIADRPDESLDVAAGRPGDPAAVAAAAGGTLTALRDGPLLLFAAADVWPDTVFRTLQCPVTDPVSFALIDGRAAVRFPDARGWASRDWAARGVAEHRARMARPPEAEAEAVALALTAARAALLAEGELALTPRAAGERLGWDEAVGWWGEATTSAPPSGVGARALRAAARLPAYTSRL